jgi:hypothetical protein
MAEDQNRQTRQMSEEVAQNPGARTAAIHQNPEILDEEARNANEGESPNAAGGASKPGEVEDHVPARSNPEATDMPTSNAPHPKDAAPGNPNAAG